MRTYPFLRSAGRFGLLPLICLALRTADAGSAKWNLNPGSGDWNTATNWTPATVPNSPTDIATFDLSNITAISLSADTTVDGVIFNPGASAFTITASAGKTLTFNGQGVTNNSGTAQNFATEVNNKKVGMIFFENESTAGDSSVFTVDGGDNLNGEDSFIRFLGNSNAGNATVVVKGADPGSLGSDIYGGTLVFDESSTAANATIITKAGGSETDFLGSSTAGSASIVLEGPSATTFYGGFGGFADSSSADHCTITIEGSPGSGANAAFGGSLGFLDGSSAGNAVITINGAAGDSGTGGIVSFRGSGVSAGNATVIANGTDFQEATGGQIYFSGAKTTENATIIVNGGQVAGGRCTFLFSTEGAARAEVFGNGTIVVDPDLVNLGSIEGDGLISLESVGSLHPNTLVVGSNNLSTVFSGVIQRLNSPRVGDLQKVGTGTLTLTGANTYTGGTTISSGILVVSNSSGSGTGEGAVSVNGGTLGGSGIIAGAVTVGTNSGVQAFLAPSKATKTPATLAIQGALTLNDDSTYLYKLDTKHRLSDQVLARGVTIDDGAKFSLRASGTTRLPLGQVFTVISNTSESAIAGRFRNLPDGAIVTVNGNNLQASYTGGDGNDLTLTVVP